MNRKFFVLLTVCLFTGAVAIGVHVMHRDAFAADTFKVFLHDDEFNSIGSENIFLEIVFFENDQEVDRDDMPYDSQADAYSWTGDPETTWEEWSVAIIGAEPVVTPIPHYSLSTYSVDIEAEPW